MGDNKGATGGPRYGNEGAPQRPPSRARRARNRRSEAEPVGAAAAPRDRPRRWPPAQASPPQRARRAGGRRRGRGCCNEDHRAPAAAAPAARRPRPGPPMPPLIKLGVEAGRTIPPVWHLASHASPAPPVLRPGGSPASGPGETSQSRNRGGIKLPGFAGNAPPIPDAWPPRPRGPSVASRAGNGRGGAAANHESHAHSRGLLGGGGGRRGRLGQHPRRRSGVQGAPDDSRPRARHNTTRTAPTQPTAPPTPGRPNATSHRAGLGWGRRGPRGRFGRARWPPVNGEVRARIGLRLAGRSIAVADPSLPYANDAPFRPAAPSTP